MFPRSNFSPSSILIVMSSCMLLAGCATGGLRSHVGASPSDSTPFEYTMAETYPLPAAGHVRLSSSDAHVTITGSDRDDVRVEVHYRISASREKLAHFTYRVSASQGASELYIKEERQTGTANFVYDQQAHIINIELPRHTQITVSETDGRCTLTGVNGRVRLTMDDGEAHLENCAGEVTVSMDNGRLTQKECAAVKLERR